jgi:hypothetical protein
MIMSSFLHHHHHHHHRLCSPCKDLGRLTPEISYVMTILGGTPLDEWSARHKGLYLHRTIQHRNTKTNIHASNRIRTHNPSNQAANTHALDRKWRVFLIHWISAGQCCRLLFCNVDNLHCLISEVFLIKTCDENTAPLYFSTFLCDSKSTRASLATSVTSYDSTPSVRPVSFHWTCLCRSDMIALFAFILSKVQSCKLMFL